jgi:hypothetical protein
MSYLVGNLSGGWVFDGGAASLLDSGDRGSGEQQVSDEHIATRHVVLKCRMPSEQRCCDESDGNVSNQAHLRFNHRSTSVATCNFRYKHG